MYTATDDQLRLLAERARDTRVRVDKRLEDALAALDADLQDVAEAIGTTYIGPGVGLDGADEIYRLVLGYHVWDLSRKGWGLFVCDAAPGQDLRPMWRIHGAGRVRKQAIVRQLPSLLSGYRDAVAEQGQLEGAHGERLTHLAERLQNG